MPTELEISFVKELKQYDVFIVYTVIMHTQSQCRTHERAMVLYVLDGIYGPAPWSSGQGL